MKRLLLVLLLAACRTEPDAPPPTAMTAESVGHYCQMNLLEHPGPKAQVFLEGSSAPLFFSQVRDAIAYMRAPEQVAPILAVYVNDMGRAGATWERSMAEGERLFSYGPDVRRVMYTTNAVESVNASFRKVVRRGCFPDEDAVMKLLYLRVKELYSRWGEGCHQPGWARVRNQLLCDEGIRARIERFL